MGTVKKIKKALKDINKERKTQKRMIEILCEETGWPVAKAKEELTAAMDKYGVTAKTYVYSKLYAMDEESIPGFLEKKEAKEKTRRAYAKIVANRSDMSPEEAYRVMKEVKKQYGISFRQYVAFNGEKCKTDEELKELQKKVDSQNKRKSVTLIKRICKVTGWTAEEAEQNIAHVHETFGLSARQYFNLGYYMLDDDGIREALDEGKKRKAEIQAKVAAQSGWDIKDIDSHMSYVKFKLRH